MATEAARANTFPKLLLRNARLYAGRPAYRHKDLGIWQVWTWTQVLEEVLARLNRGTHPIAVGLAAIPEKIRGFGHVKARHLVAAKADEAALLEQFRSGKPPLLKAAE